MSDDRVEIVGSVKKNIDDDVIKTDNAILFSDGDIQVWLPLSQIDEMLYLEENSDRTITVSINIPEWLAIEKGLV